MDKAPSRATAVSFGAWFAGQNWGRFAGTSAALLIPVYWHQRIEAGDLGSHLYNAWLAQLIRQGQAPGLWIAHQWYNVFFDLLLNWCGYAFSLRIAEKIAVSIAVLIFFWGAFALIRATTGSAPWRVSPLIAVFAYGWTFEMGFMNYYISLGLCFFALAIFLHSENRKRIIALALVPLIWMAHPLGLIFLAASAGYILLARWARPRYQVFVLLTAGVFFLGARTFLANRYEVKWNPLARYFFFNGADQVALYGTKYYVLYTMLAALFLVILVKDAISRGPKGGFWEECGIPLQLYMATGAAAILLPTSIQLSSYLYPLSYLTPRLSSVSGILACWILSSLDSKKWHVIGYALIATMFFAFLYIDTGSLNRIEEQVEQSLAALPPGHRVVGDVGFGGKSRVVTEHILDRACIGRCFSYENYEPYSEAFRVRAVPGNSIDDAGIPETRSAKDFAKTLDPPVFQISQCEGSLQRICVRELSADELNKLIEGEAGP